MAATRRRRGRVDPVDIGLGVWSVLVYVFLFLPIGFMVAHSFNKGGSLFVWGGFGTKWFGDALWSNAPLVESVKTSLKMALGCTSIAVVLGGAAGIALARRPGRWTAGFMALVFLILVTPEIVDAIGLQLWFVKLAESFGLTFFRQGLWPLWVGVSIFSSAVVALIVRARMAGLDESLEEAAADLYATPIKAFWQVTMPLVAPGLLAGGLLSFTFALDNVVVSNFVAPAGSTPYSVYVFSNAFKSTVRPYVGSMSTILLGATLLAFVLVGVVLKRSGDSAEKVVTTLAGA